MVVLSVYKHVHVDRGVLVGCGGEWRFGDVGRVDVDVWDGWEWEPGLARAEDSVSLDRVPTASGCRSCADVVIGELVLV